MLIILFIAVAIPLTVWLLTELRSANAWLRISCGIFVVVLSGFLAHWVTGIMFSEEQASHRVAMRMIEARLTEGKADLVLSAVRTYEQVASTGSTAKAAVAVIQTLEKKRTSNGEPATPPYSEPAARPPQG